MITRSPGSTARRIQASDGVSSKKKMRVILKILMGYGCLLELPTSYIKEPRTRQDVANFFVLMDVPTGPSQKSSRRRVFFFARTRERKS